MPYAIICCYCLNLKTKLNYYELYKMLPLTGKAFGSWMAIYSCPFFFAVHGVSIFIDILGYTAYSNTLHFIGYTTCRSFSVLLWLKLMILLNLREYSSVYQFGIVNGRF